MISRLPSRTRRVVALWCAFAAPAYAAACTAAPLARLEIYDRADGRTLETYRHRGASYVVGEPGHEYSLRIRNQSSGRVLAVISVDGINVVTGETASPDQSGYVIDPGDVLDLQGWRKDLERTAAFYFTNLGDSYAARTGRPGDVGVIGVAVYREADNRAVANLAEPQPPAREAAGGSKSVDRPQTQATETSRRDRSEAASAADAPLGTGHGRREYAPARRVAFERRSERPEQLLTIRYDSRAQLVARGVLPRPPQTDRTPQPFPGSLVGFVPDP